MPDNGGGSHVPPRLVVLAGRKGRPSLLPFVAVLLVLLGLGLIGLLMLNTALNKGAFALRQENRTATSLTQQDQQYQQDLAKLSEPGALASQASSLGLVPNGNPAFLDPDSGAVLGVPTPAPTPTPSATGAPTAPGEVGALVPNVPAAPSGTAATPTTAATATTPTTPTTPATLSATPPAAPAGTAPPATAPALPPAPHPGGTMTPVRD